MSASRVAEGDTSRVGWFFAGSVVGAVGAFAAMVKLLNDNGWSLFAKWDHEPRKP